MDSVVKLVPKGAAPVDQVLAAAQSEGLSDIVVVGWDKSGTLYFKTSYSDGPNVLWLLEQTRDTLLAEGRE